MTDFRDISICSKTPEEMSPRSTVPIYTCKSPAQASQMSSILSTPRGRGWERSNPFDTEPEQLTLPSCSPSMFVSMCKPGSGSRGSFRWSIEQMAVLCPANIDEEPNQHCEIRDDHLYEEKSQRAIETFFSRRDIVPSPWDPPGQTLSRVARTSLLRTPADQSPLKRTGK